MIYPQVNLNGTSAESLVEQYKEVYTAIDEAIKALRQATPHGRDYQLDPSVYTQARDEHVERMRVLEKVQAEVLELALNVQKQER